MVLQKKRKLILYLSSIFIAAQVAASIGTDPDTRDTHLPDPPVHNPQLNKKIVAFKKGGVERKINTNAYDVEIVIEYAQSLLGTPHVMGGYSPSGVDCSGLVKLAHAQVDVALPRSSHDQGRYGTLITPGEKLKRGDIVFFHSTFAKPQLITHTGIYLGDNKFIHTSSSRGVTISKLFDSGYWQDHYLFATRLQD